MTEVVTYVVLALSILLTSVAQVMQKHLANQQSSSPATSLLQRPLFWVSLTCLGIALLLWLVVLNAMPVGQAYPMLSLSYIIVMLLARAFFDEIIPSERWYGAALIITGVICLMGGAA